MSLLRAACVLAAILTTGACASTGAVPRPFPMPPAGTTTGTTAEVPPGAPAATPSPVPPPVPPVTTTTEAGDPHADAPGVLSTALALIGVPYRNGGSTPDGFDCSGFTQWVFAQHGVALPRETQEQFSIGLAIDSGEVEAGDLIFFRTIGRRVSHVGIALDEDRFVHAPNSRGAVRIERRSSAYWSRRYLGARRLDLEAGGH